MPQIQFLIVWPTEGGLPRRWWSDRDDNNNEKREDTNERNECPLFIN